VPDIIVMEQAFRHKNRRRNQLHAFVRGDLNRFHLGAAE
jgi:hypothetical protein